MARLKKGSKEAKAWGRKMARLRNAPKRKKKRVTKTKSYSSTKYKRRTMAKRKTKKKSYKKTAKIFGINVAKATSAMLYGAGRQKASNMISPYTSKIPLGAVSDEVGMYLMSSLAKKYLFKKAGVVRDALSIGQNIELARIGEAIINGELNLGFLSGNNQASSTSGTAF